MASKEKIMEGYVKTSNLYLCILVALAFGFLGGVLFSTYKYSRNVAAKSPPSATPSGPVPMSQDQSQKLAALIQATQTTPDNVNAWTQLGHFYFDTSQHKKAIEAYEKSLALDPNRPDVWTDLGVMYRRAGSRQKAIQHFDRALSINKQHEIAMFNKGVVLMHDLNDLENALKSWEELLSINPLAQTPSGQPIQTMVDQLKKNKTK